MQSASFQLGAMLVLASYLGGIQVHISRWTAPQWFRSKVVARPATSSAASTCPPPIKQLGNSRMLKVHMFPHTGKAHAAATQRAGDSRSHESHVDIREIARSS